MPEVTETELAAKAVAPRVTEAEVIEAGGIPQYYVFPQSLLTVCCLTLPNGFTVTGESACADPRNFDSLIGERIAYDNALRKIWPLLGYVLKERLHRQAGSDEPNPFGV